MRIAQLAPADAAAFQALRLRDLAECPTAFRIELRGGVRYADCSGGGTARATRRRHDTWRFMARDLVGVVGVRREEPRKLSHKAYMWGMYVALHARKAGVGRALVRHALSYARTQLHVRRVNLGVNAPNVPALSLYEGHGFERIGFEPCFMLVDGEPQNEIRMALALEHAVLRQSKGF